MGTVTFLFTDVEDSTKHWDRNSTLMSAVLARHDEILRTAISDNQGYIFKTIGDAFCASFATPLDALKAALKAQQAIPSESVRQEGDKKDIPSLRVRMALHTGIAEWRDDDYFGPPLNRVARVLSLAKGGQILLSDVTSHLVTDVLPEHVTVRYVAEKWLKGLSRPEQIFEVVFIEQPVIRSSPYRGLFAFQEQDSPFFFGREVYAAKLTEAVHKQTLTAVVGASGSGKSSLIFAGLIPTLRQEDKWLVAQFRPGEVPFQSLAVALLSVLDSDLRETERFTETRKFAKALMEGEVSLYETAERALQKSASSNFLLVADQFEELYTLCKSEVERGRFIDTLLAAKSQASRALFGAPRFVIVLSMRADFVGHTLAHRAFADALQDNDLKLGPMTRDELKAAIERPAQRLNVDIEDGLTERILDAVGRTAGNLPLLEFALTQLWEKQRNYKLTHEAYDEIGGVERALARYADEVYARLSSEEQQQVQKVFTQLVRPGEGTEDTRRLASRNEVADRSWQLLSRLADARLVVSGRDESTGIDTAEIVHEALIRGWQRLRDWVEADREFRTWQERLRAAIHQWDASHRDEGALLRGATLLEAERWLQNRQEDLSQPETDYIEASLAVRRREHGDRTRLRRLIVGSLAGGLLIALGLTVLATLQWQQAEQQRVRADELYHVALSRQLTSQAYNQLTSQLDLSLLLSLEANRLSAEPAARGSLLAAVEASPHLRTYLRGHDDDISSVAVNPEGTLLASSSTDGTIRLWDAKTLQAIGSPLVGHKDKVESIAFSPDGKLLASGSDDKTVILWDVATRQPSGQPLAAHTDTVWVVAFSPDGTTLASGGLDNTVVLWDVATRTIKQPVLAGHLGAIRGVAFSPNGETLVAVGDYTAVKWTIDASPPLSESLKSIEGGPINPEAKWSGVAFQPDGDTLALVGNNGLMLLNVRTEEAATDALMLDSNNIYLYAVAFSTDGRTLAVGGYDNMVHLLHNDREKSNVLHWQPRQLPLTGHADWINTVAFSPDGQMLLSGGADSAVIVWDLTPVRAIAQPAAEEELNWPLEQVSSLAQDQEGKLLAVAGCVQRAVSASRMCDSSQVVLFDLAKRSFLDPPLHTSLDDIHSLTFDRDSQGLLMATESDEGSTVLEWDIWAQVPTSKTLAMISHPVHATSSLAISSDGRTLAAGSEDSSIILWDVGARQQIGEPLSGHKSEVTALAFSPDGKMLASASIDKAVILWDVKKRQPVGNPLKGFGDPVVSLAFSYDGRMLALGGPSGQLSLWDVDSQTLFSEPATRQYGEVHLGFNTAGNTLISVSDDPENRIMFWDMRLESWQSRACAMAGRDLTQGEWQQYMGVIPYHSTCERVQGRGLIFSLKDK